MNLHLLKPGMTCQGDIGPKVVLVRLASWKDGVSNVRINKWWVREVDTQDKELKLYSFDPIMDVTQWKWRDAEGNPLTTNELAQKR
jgi:hypothetical protein